MVAPPPCALLLLGQFSDARSGVQMMLVSKAWRPQPAERLPLVANWAAELRAEKQAEHALDVARLSAASRLVLAARRDVARLREEAVALEAENSDLRALSTF